MEGEREIMVVMPESPRKRVCYAKEKAETCEYEVITEKPHLSTEKACEWVKSLDPVVIGLMAEDVVKHPIDVQKRMAVPIYTSLVESLLEHGIYPDGKDLLYAILPRLAARLPFPEEAWDECRALGYLEEERMKEIMRWIFVTVSAHVPDVPLDRGSMNAGLLFCMRRYCMSEFMLWVSKTERADVDGDGLYATAIALGEFEYFEVFVDYGILPLYNIHKSVLETIHGYSLLDADDYFARYGDMELVGCFETAATLPCPLANLRECDPDLLVKHAKAILDSGWLDTDDAIACLILLVQHHNDIGVEEAMERKVIGMVINTMRILGYVKAHE